MASPLYTKGNKREKSDPARDKERDLLTFQRRGWTLSGEGGVADGKKQNGKMKATGTIAANHSRQAQVPEEAV
jgi:hypothetical protein